MMNLDKVLEVLNNGICIKIKESNYTSNNCMYSESSYTATLKEGGMIKIKQINNLTRVYYEILLYIPNKKEHVEKWTFNMKRKYGWFSSKLVKDPMYDEVKSTFYNIYYKVSQEKIEEYSKYFPQ